MLLLSVSHRFFFITVNQLFFTLRTIVRGVNVGIGHGSSMGSAKRQASVQALEYLKTYGNGPTTTVIRIELTGKFSASLNATVHVIPGLALGNSLVRRFYKTGHTEL
jgi:hypothetical protein